MTAPANEPAVTDRVRQVLAAVLKEELHQEHDAVELRERYPSRYDSLAVLDAVGAVETEFGIMIDLINDDLRYSFASVATISDLVTRKLHDRAVLERGL